MPNRPTIDIFQRVNCRTMLIDYTVDVYDNYAHTTLVFECGHKVINSDNDDDMALLKEIVEAKDNRGEHGSSCNVLCDIFDYIVEHEIAIRIGERRYEWSQIKEIMAPEGQEI